MMLQDARRSIPLVLVSLLLGFGLGTLLLRLPSASYTDEPVISMAAAPSTQRALQPIQASKGQFLRPLMKMESEIQALPPAEREKLGMKIDRDLLKAMTVAGGSLALPHAAHAATLTPSVKNLLKSSVAGGLVVFLIAAAVVAVATFDPIERS